MGAVPRSCVENNLVTVVEQSARSGTAETVATASDEMRLMARLGGAGRQPDRVPRTSGKPTYSKRTLLYSLNSFWAKWYRLLVMTPVSWPLVSTRQM